MEEKQMESMNPIFNSEIKDMDQPQDTVPAETKPNWKRVVLSTVGCVALASVGFVAGYFASPGGSVNQDVTSDPTILNREERLQQMVYEHPEIRNISAAELNSMVDDFESSGVWDENFIPSDFVEELYAYRNTFDGTSDASARSSQPVHAPSSGSNYPYHLRRLDRSFDTELVAAAFVAMDGPSESNNFPDPIVSGSDVMSVFASTLSGNKVCYIIAQGTNEASDWLNNANFGKEDILSIDKKSVKVEACGCKRKRAWWCAEYNTCLHRYSIGVGVEGSVDAWNDMSERVASQVASKCQGATNYIYSGHSRGGSIVSLAAFTLYKANIVPKEKTTIVSFGCPRTFDKDTSDEAHANLFHYRMINKRDPVPSVPYGWQGFKHFGTVSCNQCGYDETRDSPGFLGLGGVNDHIRDSYRPWLT